MKAASFFSLNFASIGFKKRHSIVKKIDFVDDKIFFGIERIGSVTEMIGLAREAIISVPVSIDFGLEKHVSVAKTIVFAGEKIFFVVQKIGFVAETIRFVTEMI